MLIITNKTFLREYTQTDDQESNVKNFRLYFKGEATNLIWYDGRIIYIPKEYFELRNLVNVDMSKRLKVVLHAHEIELLRELENKEIPFLLEENLRDLFDGIQSMGLNTSILMDVGIESIDDNDYTNLLEPIYLGNGSWINIEGRSQ